MIPGIDNRNHYDSKSAMMSCHGLPTPPHSALESRRPSLQFSAMADYGTSAGSAVGAFSHPSTPVRGLSRHGDSFNQSWGEQAVSASNTPSNHLVHSLSGTHLSQPLLQPAFQSQQAYQGAELEYVGPYTDSQEQHAGGTLGSSVEASPHGMWHAQQHAHTPMRTDVSAGLGPPLFAMSHQLVPETSTPDPLGMHTSSIYEQQPYHAPVESFHGYGTMHDTTYTQPQVVVPSQLSPLDDFDQQYHALARAHNMPEGYATSFDSSTGIMDDFEMVRPPSPSSAYFAQSEDEESYTTIKSERFANPLCSMQRSKSGRPRRRSSKRVRNGLSHIEYRHTIGNIDVRCGFNPHDGIPAASSSPRKSFRCKHLLSNGMECGTSFERSEHLKRHAKKHSDVKEYPCPMPECGRAIQRPDNAADHFKTHLKPDKKGKRNKHFDWCFLRRSIAQAYNDSEQDRKRAAKLLDNLQKWIDAGMPESNSQTRGVTRN